jgi:hypothetical protein
MRVGKAANRARSFRGFIELSHAGIAHVGNPISKTI